MGSVHWCCQKRRKAVTLTEVKDALFQDYVQEGDNRSYLSLTLPSSIVRAHRHSLAGVQSPSSGRHSFLRKEDTERALFFSRPGTSLSNSKRQELHSPSFTGLPPLTLPKFPGVALKSHR